MTHVALKSKISLAQMSLVELLRRLLLIQWQRRPSIWTSTPLSSRMCNYLIKNPYHLCLRYILKGSVWMRFRTRTSHHLRPTLPQLRLRLFQECRARTQDPIKSR